MACCLQRLGIAHQEPFFGATADTHHDSGRSSQPQSTGTSDDKHRDGSDKAVLPAICRTKEAHATKVKTAISTITGTKTRATRSTTC